MQTRHTLLLPMLLATLQCSPDTPANVSELAPDPGQASPATQAAEFDSFVMRNEEIRADIIDQFNKQGVEYWLNEDGSIRFRTADTRQVDQIATEARLVWISLQ